MTEFLLLVAAVIVIAVWALSGNDNPYKLPKE